MRKASQYRQNAVECRSLAAKMETEDQRKLLLEMAEHWEGLAEDRAALVRKYPELAKPGEHEEEGCRSSRG